MMNWLRYLHRMTSFACIGFIFMSSLEALTIEEKREQLLLATEQTQEENMSQNFNLSMAAARKQLAELYQQGAKLLKEGKGVSDFELIAKEIAMVKDWLEELKNQWKESVLSEKQDKEVDALWHSPDITVAQLVADYGERDTIYLIPEEVGKIKLSLWSEFPVPREAWSECLTLILNVFGVGSRSLNPFICELYNVAGQAQGVNAICHSREALTLVSDDARVCYILSGVQTDTTADMRFLRKFARSSSVEVESIAGKLFICGAVREVTELLKLYDFAAEHGNFKQEFRLVYLCKTDLQDIKTVLQATFRRAYSEGGGDPHDIEDKLCVLSLESHGNVLFLSGPQELVDKAVSLIKSIEEGMNSPREKTIYWYKVKHSDPEELADLITKVYGLWEGKGSLGIAEGFSASLSGMHHSNTHHVESIVPTTKEKPLSSQANLVAKPYSVKPWAEANNNALVQYGRDENTVVVDTKTGTLVMVIEKDKVPLVRAIFKRLDKPKKMINIEVLLFERKVSSHRQSGMNLLRFGEAFAKGLRTAGLQWSTQTGILDFVFSKPETRLPAYDLAYQFLMSQEDIQINANPSVLTLNRTPATIAIVDELSIAVADIVGTEKDTNRVTQYQRAQFGVNIHMVPTISVGEKDDEYDDQEYILLETNVNFDTTQSASSDRPNVTRRHITNNVRIPDGDTVVIGGLRSKTKGTSRSGIPLLGEIPGIGKLFSMAGTESSSKEMFIFITPKIVEDPAEAEYKEKQQRCAERHGDCDELRQALQEAKVTFKNILREKALKAAAEKVLEKTIPAGSYEHEYDGRS